MKKIVLVLIMMIFLTSCTKAQIQPTSKEPLFKINDKTITEADLFKTMRLSNAGHQLLRSKAQEILMDALVEEDDVYQEKLNEKLNELKVMMGDSWDIFLEANGFENEDEYKNGFLKGFVKSEILLINTLEKDFETLKKQRPRQVRIAEIQDEFIDKALEDAKLGNSIESIYNNYGVKSTTSSVYDGALMIVSDIADVDTVILNPLLNEEENGFILEIISDASTQKHYLLELVSTDTEVLKDEIIEHFLNDSPTYNSYMLKLFKENKFKVYDQDLHDRIKADYPGYLS